MTNKEKKEKINELLKLGFISKTKLMRDANLDSKTINVVLDDRYYDEILDRIFVELLNQKEIVLEKLNQA